MLGINIILSHRQTISSSPSTALSTSSSTASLDTSSRGSSLVYSVTSPKEELIKVSMINFCQLCVIQNQIFILDGLIRFQSQYRAASNQNVYTKAAQSHRTAGAGIIEASSSSNNDDVEDRQRLLLIKQSLVDLENANNWKGSQNSSSIFKTTGV